MRLPPPGLALLVAQGPPHLRLAVTARSLLPKPVAITHWRMGCSSNLSRKSLGFHAISLRATDVANLSHEWPMAIFINCAQMVLVWWRS